MGANCSCGTGTVDTRRDSVWLQKERERLAETRRASTMSGRGSVQKFGTDTLEDDDCLMDAKQFPTTHAKCRTGRYPGTDDVKRSKVPAEKVRWDVSFPGYKPPEYFAIQPVPIEEDPDYRKESKMVCWNQVDGHVNRESHQGQYEIVDKLPRNPVGRTGVSGRGRLARFGPNHAADPVVSRWKRDENGETMMRYDKPVLQFITIKRGDTGQWAIPGGFVDTGEEAYDALKREFCEEAMNSESLTDDEKKQMEENIELLFQDGVEVYCGYVDDPRNTDNSWMETVVVNFHDETGELVGKLDLNAGDDAVGVQWIDVECGLDLYASHSDFIKRVATMRDAFWKKEKDHGRRGR